MGGTIAASIEVNIDIDGMMSSNGPEGFGDYLGPLCLGMKRMVSVQMEMKPMHHSTIPFM